MCVGVLALQGDFEAHARMLDGLGADARRVRVPGDLEGLDGLIIPGGESTTMTLGVEREGLVEPLRGLVRAGTPTLGTCAGLIMLDRDHLALLDVSAERNAFGRQVRSFEADLELELETPEGDAVAPARMRAVFIRAPVVADYGPGTEVLAAVDGRPIAVREGDVLAVAFHPEIAGEAGLHRWLVERAVQRRAGHAGVKHRALGERATTADPGSAAAHPPAAGPAPAREAA